ncbi:CbiX/SirB N-terminal domain-containing protein [Citricoccus sp. I39-566]|uniref:sirohydrochlorin chelatase n=1 Tax=Citricoccus sp. I39-566 TaxID=3073268 RepID=UPI00286CACED|nr:CbiX/SirB N-terminal domain-containing protein [Citricoccus sp. I39-566]WMY79116.1 CbiX/SirB N-terminal domain-containing protein [Citricoccus sp. I39-566]
MNEPMHVVACAHGTDDQDGQRAVDRLRAEVADLSRRRGIDVRIHEAYVDVQGPRLDDVLASLPVGEPAVVLPLLLSTGHHTQVDIRRAADSRPGTLAAAPIGPDRRLAVALAERLARAGLDDGDRVVLASAGTRVARGIEEVVQLAAWLGEEIGRPVTAAFGTAAEPNVRDAVRDARAQGGRRVILASYLLAPGFFHAMLARAGADVVTGPLLPSGLVAECAVDRLAEVLHPASHDGS